MRRRTAVIASVVVLALAGGGAVAATTLSSRDTGRVSDETGLPPATAVVERGDLSDSTQVDGTLGYSRQRKVSAGSAGTLTWAPGAGTGVKRDGKLYEIDGTPVRLMYGAGPMYRTLKNGDKGRDVRQLEENLAALGYTGFTVDDEYSGLTAAAVKRWQQAHDLKQTGEAGPGQIAFAPGAVRVRKAAAAVGDQVAPGSSVLSTTGSERVVTFGLDVSESKSVEVGTKVSVDLPDGSTAKGAIASIGKTAEPGDDPQDKTPKIAVTVSFDEPDKAGGIDQAPVTVNLTGETRKAVLTVPVDALLARADGGFGVQVVQNGKAREVAVELGLFGQGRVEVSGGGLREGMKVGVPKI
ncbi:peptidoglycan-binding protein [Streptomyces sp. NPDC058221]|uniref:peptidoglycan-binding protein n=1 Tax=Streptomyces sp. NPDC058221 TaxID=3346388 RepID=UPI0036EFC929